MTAVGNFNVIWLHKSVSVYYVETLIKIQKWKCLSPLEITMPTFSTQRILFFSREIKGTTLLWAVTQKNKGMENSIDRYAVY